MFTSAWDGGQFKPESFQPAVDLVEQEAAYEIHADLPGVDEKDVEVTLNDGALTISAKRESAKDEDRDGFKLRERYQGSYSRSFRLGSKVDSEKIEASYNNGVLKVVIPKAAEAQPRQIPVSVN
jgi:HSP20 family protein